MMLHFCGAHVCVCMAVLFDFMLQREKVGNTKFIKSKEFASIFGKQLEIRIVTHLKSGKRFVLLYQNLTSIWNLIHVGRKKIKE